MHYIGEIDTPTATKWGQSLCSLQWRQFVKSDSFLVEFSCEYMIMLAQCFSFVLVKMLTQCSNIHLATIEWNLQTWFSSKCWPFAVTHKTRYTPLTTNLSYNKILRTCYLIADIEKALNNCFLQAIWFQLRRIVGSRGLLSSPWWRNPWAAGTHVQRGR